MEPTSSLSDSQDPVTWPYPEPDQFTPCTPSHFVKIYFNVILQLMLESSKWSLSLRFLHQNPPCTLPFTIRATCPAHLILQNFNNRVIFGAEHRSVRTSLWTFLQFPVTSSLLGTNILLITLLSNIPRLRSSLIVSDQVSRPYTTGKIMALCILILILLGGKLEDKRFSAEWQQAFLDFSLLLISSWIDFHS